MKTIDIVVPCFNEAPCVRMLYDSLDNVLSQIETAEWSVIFVNDGSKDNTLNEIRQLVLDKGESRVKYVSFSRNFGKESAIFAGLSYSTGDYVALMDADLQHPPELLPQMIAALDEG